MTLIQLVERQFKGQPVNYSNTEAIYLSVPFSEKSEVRFGQNQFKNGGLLDDKKFFCTNEQLTEKIDWYVDSDYSQDYAMYEIAEYLLRGFLMGSKKSGNPGARGTKGNKGGTGRPPKLPERRLTKQVRMSQGLWNKINIAAMKFWVSAIGGNSWKNSL